MGERYFKGYSRTALIQEITSSQSDERGCPRKCLRHKTVGNVLWTVWEVTESDGFKDRRIVCYVLMRHPDGWGYNTLDESMAGFYVTCPPAYLKMTPPLNTPWRIRVFKYWEALRAARKGAR